MSRIISFRGKLATASQDTIALQTNNGLIGYRIKKFALINSNVGDVDYSAVLKIYKTDQTGSFSNDVDFSDNRLIGVGFISGDASSTQFPEDTIIIFDNEIFNQDIFVTCVQTSASDNDSCNYYLELEQMKLDLSEQTVATLKDIRNVGAE